MQEQWRRVVLTRRRHWRRVGSRAAGKNNRGDLQRLPPLFIVFAGGDNHRDLQQEKKKRRQLILNHFFFFKYVLGLPPF